MSVSFPGGWLPGIVGIRVVLLGLSRGARPLQRGRGARPLPQKNQLEEYEVFKKDTNRGGPYRRDLLNSLQMSKYMFVSTTFFHLPFFGELVLIGAIIIIARVWLKPKHQ